MWGVESTLPESSHDLVTGDDRGDLGGQCATCRHPTQVADWIAACRRVGQSSLKRAVEFNLSSKRQGLHAPLAAFAVHVSESSPLSLPDRTKTQTRSETDQPYDGF